MSISTISHAIQSLTITNKRVSKAAAERNELLHSTWQAAHGNIPTEYIVWLEKSSVDNQTNQCTHGWAPTGNACVCHATFIRGQHYSILLALMLDGIIALDIFEGSVTKEKFLQFVEDKLVRISLFVDFRSDIFI